MLLRVNFNHETRNFEHSTGADSRCSFQAERRETEQKRYCHTKSSLAQKWQTGIVLLFFIENEQLALGITEIRLEEIHPLSGNGENYNFVLWKKKMKYWCKDRKYLHSFRDNNNYFLEKMFRRCGRTHISWHFSVPCS